MGSERAVSASDPFRVLFQVGAVGSRSDGDLLAAFRDRGGVASEAAFAALVQRHGPMVFGVCRRVLGGDHQAAEDAFQATFLILARKAGSVRVEDSLGRWLYGVSRKVAARARSREKRGLEPIAVEPIAPQDDSH